ncbi:MULTISPECIES: hypothetical protein [unclassified Microbulbifer]|uniref:COG4648 family protein n=1 Tax=unclassified Microbulbifer TaxID=2619833 RepID=UPI0027E47A69|nr:MULTISPECIES: hypothetical protein [unclassified Microbulbifer]
MSRFAQLLLAVVVGLYPFAVYFGIQYLSLGSLLLLLLAVAGLRLALGGRSAKTGARLVAVAMLIVAAFAWLRGDAQGLLWYPVLCNSILFAVFAYSLRQPQTIIERLARLREPDLPPAGVAYTRRVTQVWCGFFLLNGGIAAATALAGDMRLWTLYNGLISYGLMGALFAGEWLLRQRLIQKV